MTESSAKHRHTPIFEAVLGDSFNALPEPVQVLHSGVGKTCFSGVAESRGPNGLSGRITAFLFRFPSAAAVVPVTVTITADGDRELWQRDFDGTLFNSELLLNEGDFITERFGPCAMRLGLYVEDNKLYFPVTSVKLFGVLPLPKWLLPKSTAFETVDDQGRFVFDVHLLTPFGARIAHYRGWLLRSQESASVQRL